MWCKSTVHVDPPCPVFPVVPCTLCVHCHICILCRLQWRDIAWFCFLLVCSCETMPRKIMENHLITGFCSMLPSLLSQLLSQGLQGCLSCHMSEKTFGNFGTCGRDLVLLLSSPCRFFTWKSGTPKLSQPVSRPLCRLSSQARPKTAAKNWHCTAAQLNTMATQWGEQPPGSWESKRSNRFVRICHVTMSPCHLSAFLTFRHPMSSCQPQDHARPFESFRHAKETLEFWGMSLCHCQQGSGRGCFCYIFDQAAAQQSPVLYQALSLTTSTVILLPPILNTPRSNPGVVLECIGSIQSIHFEVPSWRKIVSHRSWAYMGHPARPQCQEKMVSLSFSFSGAVSSSSFAWADRSSWTLPTWHGLGSGRIVSQPNPGPLANVGCCSSICNYFQLPVCIYIYIS